MRVERRGRAVRVRAAVNRRRAGGAGERTAGGVPSDLRESEWGHHLTFRDPDNIAIELIAVQPDTATQRLLDAANPQ
jgi:hypothetical protein